MAEHFDISLLLPERSRIGEQRTILQYALVDVETQAEAMHPLGPNESDEVQVSLDRFRA